jgi:two-component system phosphate regulon sensor histidine kinase PhoR
VTEEFRRDAAAADFEITCRQDSVPSLVAADGEALSRALWNLLDNAVKYSGTRRDIEVEVICRNGLVLIAVRDHGIGIPTHELKGIFHKFTRGAAANSSGIKGTGLGLAMVRHIVEAHGGTVDVSSTAGEGSTFTIALPVRNSA